MTAFHFMGADTPLTQFLRPSLAAQGLSIVPDAAASQVLILSPFQPEASEQASDTTFDIIQSLPDKACSPEKLIFLSSAEVYGEGEFECGDCGPIPNPSRTEIQLQAKRWELLCPICGEMLVPKPIIETCKALPCNAYSQKMALFEQSLLNLQGTLDYPILVLRLFHPYWPDSSFLENSKDVIAGFSRGLLTKTPLVVYEDGNQMRDFTSGQDIVQLLARICVTSVSESGIYNVGSGQRLTLYELAAYLQEFWGREEVPYSLAETYREGDVRHRMADIQKAQTTFGYVPRFGSIAEGVAGFVQALHPDIIPIHQELPS